MPFSNAFGNPAVLITIAPTETAKDMAPLITDKGGIGTIFPVIFPVVPSPYCGFLPS
jgi:hypothetical protein